MQKIIKKEDYKKLILTLILPLIILLTKPIGMTLNQSIVLGGLFLTIIWWATGVIYKDYASIFLIILFILFGQTPVKKVFFFIASDNFPLVIASFLLSQGIVNSKIADKFSSFVLEKYCYNSIRLVIMSFILGIILIFAIPQPFPRIILLASIYLNFLKNTSINDESKSILVFSVFVASTITSLMFLNGDVIINYSAMKFGGISFSFLQWAKYMTLPTLITSIIIAISFILLFNNNLKDTFNNTSSNIKLDFDKKGKITLCITAFIIILWLTESVHGINATNVALIGTVLMFITRIISIKDLRIINISLIISLTAQFSIGQVLNGSGVADKLSSFLVGFFPDGGSLLYIPFIIVIIMILHLVMGSLVAAVSVLIPTLIVITAGNLSKEFIVLLTCSSVCFHYILPFHHVSIMIGSANGYYNNKHVIKMGILLTIITILAVLFIYIPWWKMVGLI